MVAQKTIGDGSGGTFPANFNVTPAGNYQPIGSGGQGAQAAIPTSGTASAPVAIGTPPEGAVYIRLYVPPGCSVAFTTAISAETAAEQFAAGAFKAFVQADDGPNWDEPLSNGMNVYVGPITGAGTPSGTVPIPSFRYY